MILNLGTKIHNFCDNPLKRVVNYIFLTSKRQDKIIKSRNNEFKKPLAVLVNGYSASAAEIFSGAIKDYGIGTLVGTKTYGKGIVQRIVGMEDGTAVKLTVSKYFTPNGTDIHKKGIEPDVTVELDESLKNKVTVTEEEDNQLQKAISILQEEKNDAE